MATHYEDIRKWNPQTLETSATRLMKRSDELVRCVDTLRTKGVAERWKDRGGQRAKQRNEELVNAMEDVIAGVNGVRSSLYWAASAITTLQSEITATDQKAADEGCEITGNGVVRERLSIIAPDRERSPLAPNPVPALEDKVLDIKLRASEIDRRLTSELRLVTEGGLDADDAATGAEAARSGFREMINHNDLMDQYQVEPELSEPDTYSRWTFAGPKVTDTEAKYLDQLYTWELDEANDIQQDAQRSANEIFGGRGKENDNGALNGHADAWRHAYWNARNTQEFGEEWTEGFTTGHERRPDTPEIQKAMDLHNNEVGRRIATEHPDASPDEMKEHVRQAVLRGDMVVISPSGHLVPSNDELPQDTSGPDGPKEDRKPGPPGFPH